jgi:hypothetical protein
MRNVYSNPEYQETIEKMRGQLKATRTALGEADEKRPAIQTIIDENWPN